VENATISVPRGSNVNMEHVGMLKIQGFWGIIVGFNKMWLFLLLLGTSLYYLGSIFVISYSHKGNREGVLYLIEYTESKVCVTNKDSLYGDGGDSQSCLLIETYRCSDPREGECLITIWHFHLPLFSLILFLFLFFLLLALSRQAMWRCRRFSCLSLYEKGGQGQATSIPKSQLICYFTCLVSHA
jgi:hypothetical protein